jgi:hypothetical protein
VHAVQSWSASVLNLEPNAPGVPSRLPLAGSLAGLAGILLLAGPFLRETLGFTSIGTTTEPKQNTPPPEEPQSPVLAPTAGRLLVEIAAASVAIVVLLRFWNPFGVFRLFEGDYLAGFLLILGIALLFLHRNVLDSLWPAKTVPLLAAAFAAVVLPVLIYSWLNLTISEAWLTTARWLRMPALCVAALPYHAAEELLLGPHRARSAKTRLMLGLALRLIAWGALLVGILVLHNGEILLALLAPYLAAFCLLQRTGMDVVRKGTGSPLAAALFGAILLAGFCVIVFPIT